MQLYSAATYIPTLENPSEYEAQSTSGSVVMFIAIRSGANATRKLDFCGAGMATFVTTDPLGLNASVETRVAGHLRVTEWADDLPGLLPDDVPTPSIFELQKLGLIEIKIQQREEIET